MRQFQIIDTRLTTPLFYLQTWENESIEDDNEEEEFQSQEMAREQYMIDEDASNNSYHVHVQATTTPWGSIGRALWPI